MKYTSRLICLATVLSAVAAQAQTVSNGTFSQGSNASWNNWSCPTASCSNPNDDISPYWMQVANPGTGSGHWLYFGDSNTDAVSSAISGAAYIDQSVSGFTGGLGYTLKFTYGEVYNYSYYTSPDFNELDGIYAYAGGSVASPGTTSPSPVYSANNFYVSNPPAGTPGTYIVETAVTAGFTAPGTGSESLLLEFAGYDTLQNVFLTGITIATGLPAAGPLAVTTEYFIPDATPEPATFGFMAISCILLLAAIRKTRSART
jgi:hypothetical protein